MTESKANTGFNLIDVIDALPAAEFFWYNSVPQDQKPEYCRLLGQLLQLFITPHVYPFFPYREASYLKKYERMYTLLGTDELNTTLTRLLYLESTNIDYEMEQIVLETPSGADVLQEATATFEDVIQGWYFGVDPKPLYLLNFSIVFDDGEFHSVVLAIKKYPVFVGSQRPMIKFMYFDPQGYMAEDVSFARTLKQKLVTALAPGDVLVMQFLLECPQLQLPEHGNNCVQHSAMVLTMLMRNPDLFDDARTLLLDLERHSTLNVVLFSLSIFLRTMPIIHLKRYYFSMLIRDVMSRHAEDQVPVEPDVGVGELVDSIAMSREVSTIFHVPNCPALLEERACDTTVCSWCGGRCNYQALVRMTQAGCNVLTPKEIARAMFDLYFQIKDMVGDVDPRQRSFMREQMDRELNFEVPASNEDYARLGLPVNPV